MPRILCVLKIEWWTFEDVITRTDQSQVNITTALYLYLPRRHSGQLATAVFHSFLGDCNNNTVQTLRLHILPVGRFVVPDFVHELVVLAISWPLGAVRGPVRLRPVGLHIAICASGALMLSDTPYAPHHCALLVLSTSQRDVLASVVFTHMCYGSYGFSDFALSWRKRELLMLRRVTSVGYLYQCNGHRHPVYLSNFDTITLKYTRFTMCCLLDYTLRSLTI